MIFQFFITVLYKVMYKLVNRKEIMYFDLNYRHNLVPIKPQNLPA